MHLQTNRTMDSRSLRAVAREGTHACYADGPSADCLRKNSHNVEDTIPEHVAWLQSLQTSPSPINCALALSLSSRLVHFSLCLSSA